MKKLLYLLPLLIFGCESVEEEPVTTTNPEALVLNSPVQTIDYAGLELDVQPIDSIYLYQGDILIPKNTRKAQVLELGETSKAAALTSGFWKDNIVYYKIDPNLPNKQRVFDAMKHWETYTNVKFVERTDQAGYVYFIKGSGCSSYIGYTGFRQQIVLADGCTTGTTIHEIGHAVGLWHEQARADRNNYVKIHWDNIIQGMEHNFQRYTDTWWSGQDIGSSLDFNSIMMYSPYSFSKNGLPTITRLNGSSYSVNRNVLSEVDKFAINNLYPAKEVEPTYINGRYYTLYGLTVLRYYDSWFWSGPYGMKAMKLVDGVWYYR